MTYGYSISIYKYIGMYYIWRISKTFVWRKSCMAEICAVDSADLCFCPPLLACVGWQKVLCNLLYGITVWNACIFAHSTPLTKRAVYKCAIRSCAGHDYIQMCTHAETHWNTLEHTATRSTLQHMATHCGTRLYTNVHTRWNTLEYTGIHCNTLQHAAHCSTWQHTVPRYNMQQHPACCSVLQHVAVCCSVLQCVAVCCSVLQCVAVYCSVLQCTHTWKLSNARRGWMILSKCQNIFLQWPPQSSP